MKQKLKYIKIFYDLILNIENEWIQGSISGMQNTLKLKLAKLLMETVYTMGIAISCITRKYDLQSYGVSIKILHEKMKKKRNENIF